MILCIIGILKGYFNLQYFNICFSNDLITDVQWNIPDICDAIDPPHLTRHS